MKGAGYTAKAGCPCQAGTEREVVVAGSHPPSVSLEVACVWFQVAALCRERRGRRKRQRRHGGGSSHRYSGAPSGRKRPCRCNLLPAPGQGNHLWQRGRGGERKLSREDIKVQCADNVLLKSCWSFTTSLYIQLSYPGCRIQPQAHVFLQRPTCLKMSHKYILSSFLK